MRTKFSTQIFARNGAIPFVVFVVFLAGVAQAAPRMYWVEATGALQSAELDGSDITPLLTGLEAPLGIDLDADENRIYWTELNIRDVWRSNLDGSGATLVHSNGTHQPLAITVDSVNNRLYWTDINTGSETIRRSNLDGSGQGVLLSVPTIGVPTGIAVDPANGHLYWTQDTGTSGRIMRSALDGTNRTAIFSTGASSAPIGLALDLADGKIYWTDDGLNMIRRVNLDGSNPENIVTSGLGQPMDVALHADKVYWVDQGVGINAIFRADKDGANVETLINSGINSPFAIAIMGNRPPNAAIGGPYTINEGDTLLLDASGSSDPDGDAFTTVLWDLDNDGLFDDASGLTPAVPWATLLSLGWNDGSFPISVQVSDGTAVGVPNTSVTVLNLPPNVVHGGPYTINEGDDLLLDASATTDPGFDILAFAWDINNDAVDDVFGANPTVSWATLQGFGLADASHIMRLTVDDGTVSVQVNVGLTIQNLPPLPAPDFYAVDEDKSLNIVAPGVLSNDVDPGGDLLSVVSADSASAYGAPVNVSANGAFTYDPRFVAALRILEDGEEVSDTFQYTVGDGDAVAMETVEVRVRGVAGAAQSVPLSGRATLLLAAILPLLGVVVLLRKKVLV